jgi:hypothetical protein
VAISVDRRRTPNRSGNCAASYVWCCAALVCALGHIAKVLRLTTWSGNGGFAPLGDHAFNTFWARCTSMAGVRRRIRYAAAVSWFRKAADPGDAPSQYELWRMYALGRGVPQDEAQRTGGTRKAEDQGHAGAQAALGARFADCRPARAEQDHDGKFCRSGSPALGPRSNPFSAKPTHGRIRAGPLQGLSRAGGPPASGPPALPRSLNCGSSACPVPCEAACRSPS